MRPSGHWWPGDDYYRLQAFFSNAKNEDRTNLLADISEETGKTAAEKFKVKNVFTDYRKLLEMDEVDAVSVCTPNDTHAPIAIAAAIIAHSKV